MVTRQPRRWLERQWTAPEPPSRPRATAHTLVPALGQNPRAAFIDVVPTEPRMRPTGDILPGGEHVDLLPRVTEILVVQAGRDDGCERRRVGPALVEDDPDGDVAGLPVRAG